MCIQGPAQTLLVATDRNANSLNLKEKVGFPGGTVIKNLPANAGDAGSIPGSGRSSGEGNGNPLQYSCLENSMDRGVWRATIHGVTESDTTERLSIRTYIHPHFTFEEATPEGLHHCPTSQSKTRLEIRVLGLQTPETALLCAAASGQVLAVHKGTGPREEQVGPLWQGLALG